jgi:Uma2 family endonuclease
MSTTPAGASTAKKLMTADEFWEFVHRPENLDRDFELIRGEVVEVSRPRTPHGRVAFRVAYLLEQYAERVGRGYVVTESGVVLSESPATVVGPDAAYYDDANKFEDLHPKWGDVPPVLAVEVWSPSDRPGRSNAKIREYIASGVKVVRQGD